MESPGFTTRVLLLTAVLALVVAALLFVLLWNGGSAASAQDDIEKPAKPTGLSVETERGSLTASVDWNDVAGADNYLVRWRPKSGNLNAGFEAQSSSASITVADYGRWVVQVKACNDAGCGTQAAKHFTVEPAPTATPTPTPAATPTATPEPEIPANPTGLQVATTAGSLDVSVDWNDVQGADDYRVRWRLTGPGQALNEGVQPTSSDARITVADYGRWVVRVEACNRAGCSGPVARTFQVEASPTVTPTPAATPTPTPAPASEPPAVPTGLEVEATAGSLNVSVDWDDVAGAEEYLVRWREAGPGNRLSDGVRPTSSNSDITVSGYGRWVVRVEACNDAGCGPAHAYPVCHREEHGDMAILFLRRRPSP